MRTLIFIALVSSMLFVYEGSGQNRSRGSRPSAGSGQATSPSQDRPYAENAGPLDLELVSEIVLGKVFTMSSVVLGEDREVRLMLPASYETSTARYPVVYVLDGDSYFLAATSAVRAVAGLDHMPEAIVVAVTSPDRRTDMTPPEVPVRGIDRRGGDQFLAYLADELIPTIDQHYRTLPLRILIGHSHGALFNAYALYARPEAFRWHLAIDGPLQLGDRILEKNIEQFLTQHPDHKGRISTVWIRYSWDPDRWSKLVDRADTGFRAMTFELPDETHVSMYYEGMYEGLKQLFFDYEYVHDKVITMAELDQRYARLADEYGYEVGIPKWALHYGAMEYLVSAEPVEARLFVERLDREYGDTQILFYEARAWLEELEANPPDATRADYLARKDATPSEVSDYFGQWSDDEKWSLDWGQHEGRITGSINRHWPDGSVHPSSIEKVIFFEDGSFDLSYANGRPPRSGIIAYHVVPVDEATLEVRQYFKIYTPPGEKGDQLRLGTTFTLKRVR